MRSRLVSLVKTGVIQSTHEVVAWVRNYIEGIRGDVGDKLGQLDLGTGRHYFASRPIGMLSAHGYVRDRVAAIRRATNLASNEAITLFLRDFCRQHRITGWQKMGIRMVLRIDPVKLTQFYFGKVDIDRLLVKAAEDTFAKAAEVFYPGDELGFIMGLHHSLNTLRHAASRRKFVKRQGREPGPKDYQPLICGHVLLLSHTKRDRHVNLRGAVLMDPSGSIPLDCLVGLREYYEARVQSEIYDPPVRYGRAIEPEWEPIVREAATSTLEDFWWRVPHVKDRRELRRRVLNRFRWHVRTLDHEKLARKCRERHDALLNYRLQAAKDPNLLRQKIQKQCSALAAILRENRDRRIELVDHLIASVAAHRPGTAMVKFWDIPSGKAALSAPVGFKLEYPPCMAEQIRSSLRDLEAMRQASRIQSLGELTLLSLQLQALQRDPHDPQWLDYLTRVVRCGKLPNEDLLVKVPPSAETPSSSAGSGTTTPATPIPSPNPPGEPAR